MFDYPVILEAQPEGGFVATFPDVPEAITQGEDEDEALAYAVAALETALEFYCQDGRPFPVPSPAAGRPVVTPSAQICAKLAVWAEMRAAGIRKTELARRLGWHLPQVDRLLDLHHATRLDAVERACAVFGKKLTVKVA